VARSSFHREPAEVRRRDLVEATARCLAAKGVGGISVRVICAEAGVSPGLLTHYFPGINTLIAETYRQVGLRVACSLEMAVRGAGSDAAARLRAYVVASFRSPVMDPELLATWLAFWSLIKVDADIRDAHRDVYAGYRTGVEELIAECLGERAGRTDIRLMAVTLTALVDGLWLELCLGDSAFSATQACAAAELCLANLLAHPPALDA
jgi:TetR/AcrR family transcriptional repressor of bet genes